MADLITDPAVPPDFTACPNWGMGGRYVLDAAGNRVPVADENADAPTTTPGAASNAAPAPAVKKPTPRRK